jgi:hypothetical protein
MDIKSVIRFIIYYALVAVIISGIDISLLAQDSLSIDQKKEMVRQLIDEGYNKRNFALIDNLVAVNYVEYINGIRADSASAIKKTVSWLANRAPDFRLAIAHYILEKDKIVVQWVYEGTNVKYNKVVTLHGIYIARFEAGKIAEGWQYFDNHQRYQQLGFKIDVP